MTMVMIDEPIRLYPATPPAATVAYSGLEKFSQAIASASGCSAIRSNIISQLRLVK